jgi:hypothetical protein
MKLFRMAPAALAGALLLSACEIPTELPMVEQRWIIPIDVEEAFGVAELLPDGVEVDGTGSNFVVDVDPFSTVEDLGTLCALCAALNLTTAPKPAFTYAFTIDQSLPADVQAAAITGGTINIDVSHNLGFDPVQPPGGSTGTVTITARNGAGGAAIGEVTIDGASETFAAGATVTKTMTLSTTTIGGTVQLEISVDSPAGGLGAADWVPINTSNTVSASATVQNLLVSSATVNVSDQSVDLDAQDLDVSDIDDSVTENIVSGTLILDVVNPFGVTVSGSIQITNTEPKSFSISSGATSQISISYTGNELASFLGEDNVSFSGSGTASGGLITVTPGQEITLSATLDLTIQIG